MTLLLVLLKKRIFLYIKNRVAEFQINIISYISIMPSAMVSYVTKLHIEN